MSDRDLLEPQGISSQELKSLVDEYTSKGGKIKQCPEGVALNFRLSVLDVAQDQKNMSVLRKTKNNNSKSK